MSHSGNHCWAVASLVRMALKARSVAAMIVVTPLSFMRPPIARLGLGRLEAPARAALSHNAPAGELLVEHVRPRHGESGQRVVTGDVDGEGPLRRLVVTGRVDKRQLHLAAPCAVRVLEDLLL